MLCVSSITMFSSCSLTASMLLVWLWNPPLQIVWKASNFTGLAKIPLLITSLPVPISATKGRFIFFRKPGGVISPLYSCNLQSMSLVHPTSRTTWLCDFQRAIILRGQAAHAHLHHNLLGTAKNWTIWDILPPAHRASDELPEATTSHGNSSVFHAMLQNRVKSWPKERNY